MATTGYGFRDVISKTGAKVGHSDDASRSSIADQYPRQILMPTYKPLGTKVELVTCSLASSTTPAGTLHSKDEVREATLASEASFQSVAALRETHVSCFGETTRLHFVADAPFYLVQAGAGLFEKEEPSLQEKCKMLIARRREEQIAEAVKEKATRIENEETRKENEEMRQAKEETRKGTEGKRRRSTRVAKEDKVEHEACSSADADATPAVTLKPKRAPHNQRVRTEPVDGLRTPQALALRISLTKKSFLQQFRKAGQKGNLPRQSVKLDVYFNGELARSDSATFRALTEKKDIIQTKNGTVDCGNLHLVSGHRVDRVMQIPWVIMPPKQYNDSHDHGVEEIISAEERWQRLAESIQSRADEQGFNKFGDRTALGRYLANLAAMDMPSAVEGMQTNGRAFGVVDVVISAGFGGKWGLATRFLHKPEPILNPEYGFNDEEGLRRLGAWGAFNEGAGNDSAKDEAAPAPYHEVSLTPATATASVGKRGRHSGDALSSSQPVADELSTDQPPAIPSLPDSDLQDELAASYNHPEPCQRQHSNPTKNPIVKQTKLARLSDAELMPPPRTPRRSSRRRRSDIISVNNEDSPRSSSKSSRSAVGSKSVSGFLGMTRRGIFHPSTGRKGAADVPSTPSGPPSSKTSEDGDGISRAAINGEETPILSQNLTLPHGLDAKRRMPDNEADPSSLHQPIPERVVFGLKDMRTTRSQTLAQRAPTTPSRSTRLDSVTPKLSSSLASSPPSAAERAEAPSSSRRRSKRSLPSPSPSRDRDRERSPAKKRKTGGEAGKSPWDSWACPELSKNCVLTFAGEEAWPDEDGPRPRRTSARTRGKARSGEPGPEEAEQRGGRARSVLRCVRSEKAGEFRENEVVFAVRYIVAG